MLKMSEKKRNRIIYSPIQLKGPTETSYLEVKIVTIATKVSMSALDLSGDEYTKPAMLEWRLPSERLGETESFRRFVLLSIVDNWVVSFIEPP